MTEDSRVVLLGEDLRSNLYGTSPGFLDDFGPERIWDTPISEGGFTGLAAGAAMTGLRPIVDLTYASFIYLAMDQLVNQVAKNRYMFGGQVSIPVVYRTSMYYGTSTGAQHSDRPYPMLMGVPGLTVLAPTTPRDAYGLLRSAITSDDPVVIFEDSTLWSTKEDLPDDPFDLPIGVANVLRPGHDVTLVAISGSVPHAVKAAEAVAAEGISVEVIDPRTLLPLDVDTIISSVRRTGRLVVADPAGRTAGAAAEVAALAAELCLSELVAPVQRVTAPDVQIPYSPPLERGLYPTSERIADALRAVTRSDVPEGLSA